MVTVHSAESARRFPLQDRWMLVLETGPARHSFWQLVCGKYTARGLMNFESPALTHSVLWWEVRPGSELHPRRNLVGFRVSFPCKKVTQKEKVPGMAQLHPSLAILWLLSQSRRSIFKTLFLYEAPHSAFSEESQQCIPMILK